MILQQSLKPTMIKNLSFIQHKNCASTYIYTLKWNLQSFCAKQMEYWLSTKTIETFLNL